MANNPGKSTDKAQEQQQSSKAQVPPEAKDRTSEEDHREDYLQTDDDLGRCAKELGVDPAYIAAYADCAEGPGDPLAYLTSGCRAIPMPDPPADCTDPCKIYESLDLAGMISDRVNCSIDPQLLRHLRDVVVLQCLVALRLPDCLDEVLDAKICDEDVALEVHGVSARLFTVMGPYRGDTRFLIKADAQALEGAFSNLVKACLSDCDDDVGAAMVALLALVEEMWSASLGLRVGQLSHLLGTILGLFDRDDLACELAAGCSSDGIVTVLGWCYEKLGLTIDVKLSLKAIAAADKLLEAALACTWPRVSDLAREQCKRYARIVQNASIVKVSKPRPSAGVGPSGEPTAVLRVAS